MNTDLMFSSETDLWATPQWFFDEINAKVGFTLDVCATSENAKCKDYYTIQQDGLAQEWVGKVWMNPPYGKTISKWVQKAYEESCKGNCIVYALLPSRTDTRWFHEYIYNKSNVSIEFLRGRLKFGNAKHSAPFPSMMVKFFGIADRKQSFYSN